MPNLDHLFDPRPGLPVRHRPTTIGGSSEFDLPPRPDRRVHGHKLQSDLLIASQLPTVAIDEPRPEGLTLCFESEPGFLLNIDSLDLRGSGIELLSVSKDGHQQFANVFVPDGKLIEFEKRITAYMHVDPSAPQKIRNRKLVESISSIRRAAARALFTDSPSLFPTDSVSPIWWEVWLRTPALKADARQRVDEFAEIANRLQCIVRKEVSYFPERAVFLVRCSVEEWTKSNRLISYLAELRLARTLATDFVTMPALDQREYVDDLLSRLTIAPPSAPAVLLVDTGVNRNHPLIENSLASTDWHAVKKSWSKDDRHPQQHGTAMAGIAAFGNLLQSIDSRLPIAIKHRLESAKLFRADRPHEPHNWGRLPNVAVARARKAAANRTRVVCLAMTASTDADYGAPSSWSGSIDRRAVGVGGLDRLLFIVSGGNWPSAKNSDPKMRGSIQEPGQAWNALTVGAMTEFGHPSTKNYPGWRSVGMPDGLSPWSRTAVPWTWKGHPYKPDIVIEGGNGAVQRAGDEPDMIDDIALLSTIMHPSGRLLTTFGMTSAATAEAARLVARTIVRYPTYWPETIRGLMTHSAAWTKQMKAEATVGGLLVRISFFVALAGDNRAKLRLCRARRSALR